MIAIKLFQRARAAAKSDDGSTLIETVGALTILLIAAAGLLSMDSVSTKITENYGHLSSRTTEYAQDKMEQLLVLSWGDEVTNTRVFPATPTGGTGIKVGGSSNPATPAAGYVDYLDQGGQLLVSGSGPPANWYYQRVWQISSPSPNLKQVTVTVSVKSAFAGGQPASSTLTGLKTFPF
jgi:hypothetical protein